MDLRNYLQIVRRRWLTIAVVILVLLSAAAAVTLGSTPRYTATTRVFFAVQGTQSVTDLAQGSTYAEKQMTSYAQVATSPLVLAPVIERLHLRVSAEKLAQSITVTVPLDTVILEIAYTDIDAAQAAEISNAVADQLATAAATLTPDQQDGQETVRATTFAPAQRPVDASSPDVLKNMGLGLALGVLIGVAAAVLRDALDTRIRSERDLGAVTERPILGVIAYDDEVPRHPVVIREDPSSAASESIRRLRTNLQFVGIAEEATCIVVTSSIPGEGKSTTALNLAVSLADAGSRVLLVDADLRRPSIAEYLGLDGSVGLTTALIGRARLEDIVQPWGDTTLDVLPAGQLPPNPSELLGSQAMKSMLHLAKNHYDVVMLDSPPLLPVTDAVVLTKIAGGALVLVGANQTGRTQLQSALESLETAGANVYGLVMNKISRRDADASRYYYYSGYRTEEVPENGKDNKQDLPGHKGTSRLSSGSTEHVAVPESRRDNEDQLPETSGTSAGGRRASASEID